MRRALSSLTLRAGLEYLEIMYSSRIFFCNLGMRTKLRYIYRFFAVSLSELKHLIWICQN